MTLCVHEKSTDYLYSERISQYLKAIERLRPIDDDFMKIIMNDKEVIRQFLEIMLGEPIDIIEWHVEYDIHNILARTITIDIFVREERRCINIEVQRDNQGADPRRSRYHASLMDAETSFPQEKWNELCKILVIFITEKDVLGYGLPVYHIHRIIDENNQLFDEGSEIIYVNASIQEDTAIGWLMHDMMCSNPEEMHYEFLKERVRYFKNTEGGKNEMCEIWEEIRRDGLLEGLLEGETRGRQQGLIEGAMREKLRLIQKLMSKKGYTIEEAFDFIDIPEEEQSVYRQRITS